MSSFEKHYGASIPFIDHLGIERLASSDGSARVAMDVLPEHVNSWRAVHGGVLMTMLDIVMSLATRLHIEAEPGGILTIDMSVKFLNPGRGGHIVAQGTVIGEGKSIVFCEGDVTDADGKVLAKSLGTFKRVKNRLD